MIVKVHDHTIKRSLVKYAIRFCTPSDEKACELHPVVRIGEVREVIDVVDVRDVVVCKVRFILRADILDALK